MTVYPLTDWQIGSLSVYFKNTFNYYGSARIKIESLAFTDKGNVIIGFIKDGELKTEMIPKEPNK
jgi:hypothetical protein